MTENHVIVKTFVFVFNLFVFVRILILQMETERICYRLESTIVLKVRFRLLAIGGAIKFRVSNSRYWNEMYVEMSKKMMKHLIERRMFVYVCCLCGEKKKIGIK